MKCAIESRSTHSEEQRRFNNRKLIDTSEARENGGSLHVGNKDPCKTTDRGREEPLGKENWTILPRKQLQRSILGENKKSELIYIHTHIYTEKTDAIKVEKSRAMVGNFETEVVKCGNAGEKGRFGDGEIDVEG